MAAFTETVANNWQMIDNLKAELAKVKADLEAELERLDKVKAEINAHWQSEARGSKL